MLGTCTATTAVLPRCVPSVLSSAPPCLWGASGVPAMSPGCPALPTVVTLQGDSVCGGPEGTAPAPLLGAAPSPEPALLPLSQQRCPLPQPGSVGTPRGGHPQAAPSLSPHPSQPHHPQILPTPTRPLQPCGFRVLPLSHTVSPRPRLETWLRPPECHPGSIPSVSPQPVSSPGFIPLPLPIMFSRHRAPRCIPILGTYDTK